ncbi:hypothetical protein WR25_01465 isoform D [Diploscapter pachys]|uniref:Uncharacterized protein n=1 Tax=Diploscapter pachys TaxID=2018661 RepID=A0A2A2LGP5_9BILA|nr:hypothetical protein WR25_01465 isoform A [Diploscapter pachys]PAV85406.1 hypothetical protein WR25_01465 isoform B [Diploscapter pachys]PAV85407.1 hypothetical protein WR25_01465 isoform C [Diploscapter pachys]PAV85408.1 hypothetical protein WR25_01465 isoform D [Diploscapter pachys]
MKKTIKHRIFRRTGSSSSISSLDTMNQLDRAIQNISSGIFDVARDALEQVQYLLNVDEQAAMLLERLELVLRAVAAQLHIIWQLHEQNERNTLELLGKIINLINPLLHSPDKYKLLVLPPDLVQSLLWEIVTTIDHLNPLIEASKEGAEFARLYNICAVRLCNRLDLTDYFLSTLQCIKRALLEQPPSDYKIELFHKCLNKWGTLVPQKKEKLRLIAYTKGANEFYNFFYGADDEFRAEHEEFLKTVEICWQKVIELHGDGVLDAIRRVPNPDPHLVEYVNRTLQALRKQNPTWKPQFPGGVDEQAEAVHPSEALAMARIAASGGAKQESVSIRPELKVLMDNAVRDLNGANNHVQRLTEYLSKNPEMVGEYTRYAEELPMGNLIKQWVKMRQVGPLQSISQQNIIDTAQRMFTWKSRLNAIRNGSTDGPMTASMMDGQVLQARDINSESMSSDLPIPPHLMEAASRSPEEEQARNAQKNKRRTMDKSTMDKIRSRLAGLGD